MIVSLIAAYAVDKNGRKVIGRDNKIPWHSPTDLKRFREYTVGHPVVMGRKTHQSIGRLLPERENVIVTRNKRFQVPGAHVFRSVEEAISFAGEIAAEVFIIGGEEIYKQTVRKADRLYLTEIRKPGVQGDTFFPTVDLCNFKRLCSEETDQEKFTIYQRASRPTTSSSEEDVVTWHPMGYLCF